MSFASLGSAASLVEEPADNQVYAKMMVYHSMNEDKTAEQRLWSLLSKVLKMVAK